MWSMSWIGCDMKRHSTRLTRSRNALFVGYRRADGVPSAATALEHQVTLVTADSDFQRVSGLLLMQMSRSQLKL